MKVFSVLSLQSPGRQFSYIYDVSKLIVNAYTFIHKDLVRSQRKLYGTPCTDHGIQTMSLLKAQSKELVRGPPELVQHFRL